MSVNEKKKAIQAAVQELNSPASNMSAYEAMHLLQQAVADDFVDHDGSIDDFAGDDDFKEEIFSAQVIQVVITAAKVKDANAYQLNFYHCAGRILSLLCDDNTKLADAFVAYGGVEFLLESLEAFSSDQFLLLTCFGVYASVMGSLNENESVAFVRTMILGKLVDVCELNYKTANELFYSQYCICVGNSLFRQAGGLKLNKNVIQCIVSHVWYGVLKHKYDEGAQEYGRRLLYFLVGKETAKKMIDHAEMHHCEDEECAGCA